MKGRVLKSKVATRQRWKTLLMLGILCSGLYLLLYFRASLVYYRRTVLNQHWTASTWKNLRQWNASEWSTCQWNASQWKLMEALGQSILSGKSPPLLTLFSSWGNRSDLALVRKLTLRNWAMLRPFVLPVLFTNDSALAQQAVQSGWETLPVSRAAVGVPVLKHMYLDVKKSFNSTLMAYANGDIMYTDNLVKSLLAILTDPALPLDKNPLMVIGKRTNVNNVTAVDASTFTNMNLAAKKRGKVFYSMSEDYFITNRNFPWSEIPGVIIGRVAYDNWLVVNSIQKKHVLVDITNTSLALHQTTKAGNLEGHKHANSSFNDRLLKKLYKRIRYIGGSVDCTPWRTRTKLDGGVYVEKRKRKPNYC